MARIYLDARTITATPSGIGRYARQLVAALTERSTTHEFVVLRHQSNPRPLNAASGTDWREVIVDSGIDGIENLLVGHRALDRAFRRAGPPDLYHSLFHVLPLGIRRAVGDTPVVTTLHDFVWIDHPDASQPTWLKARTMRAFGRLAIPRALRASDRVVAISEPTRRRARAYIDDHKMATISHGVDEVFFEDPGDLPAPFDSLADSTRPAIVAIGNDKDYKNLRLLIDAFARLIAGGQDAQLVLVGDCRRLEGQIEATGAGDHIRRTGFVEDDILRQILDAGRAFVFPSKVEGFGLPVLEAMATHTPTIVSDLEPMRTIAADAALLVDPDDPAALARLLERIVEDDELADRMARRGRRRAREFSWSDTARRTIELYDRVLADR